MPLHVTPHKDTHRWPKNRKWPIRVGHLEDQNKIGQTFVLYIYIILYYILYLSDCRKSLDHS